MDQELHSTDFTFSRSSVYVIRERSGSQEQAIADLYQDLRSGFIRAVGYESTSPTSRVRKEGGKLPKLQFVPQRFWQLSTDEDMLTWDWKEGDFSLAAPYVEMSGASSAWRDVRFETSLLSEVGKPRSSRGRKRSAVWSDWIAAAVILAADPGISSSLTPAKLVDEISDVLDGWGLTPLSHTTALPAARTILERVREADSNFRELP